MSNSYQVLECCTANGTIFIITHLQTLKTVSFSRLTWRGDRPALMPVATYDFSACDGRQFDGSIGSCELLTMHMESGDLLQQPVHDRKRLLTVASDHTWLAVKETYLSQRLGARAFGHDERTGPWATRDCLEPTGPIRSVAFDDDKRGLQIARRAGENPHTRPYGWLLDYTAPEGEQVVRDWTRTPALAGA